MYKKGVGNDKQRKDAGNRTLCPYRNFSQAIIMLTNRLSGIKVSENKTGLKFCQNLRIFEVVRIMLYRPAISQSDCRKAGPYHLPCNNVLIKNSLKRV